MSDPKDTFSFQTFICPKCNNDHRESLVDSENCLKEQIKKLKNGSYIIGVQRAIFMRDTLLRTLDKINSNRITDAKEDIIQVTALISFKINQYENN